MCLDRSSHGPILGALRPRSNRVPIVQGAAEADHLPRSIPAALQPGHALGNRGEELISLCRRQRFGHAHEFTCIEEV